MVKRFKGSGRLREGGAPATHKQDFNAHVKGGDWRHKASQIDLSPTLSVGNTVQQVLENISSSDNGQGFITIGGDGYDNCAQDLSLAFTSAFSSTRLSNGGIILIRAGTYCMQSTVTVPNGISIIGEAGGVIIIGEMSETPLFLIQTGSTKNEIESGVPTVQFDEQNIISNIKFYDNLNGTVASGGPSMSAVPMLQMQHGASLLVHNCDFIGKSVLSSSLCTHRAIGFTGITTIGVGTVLHVHDSYFDGVKTAIDFDGRQGDLDYLTVRYCRARTFGDNSTGSIEDRFFIATTICNIDISNNLHNGLKTDWGAAGCVYIKNFNPTNTDLSMTLLGNIGGLDASGSADFLIDARVGGDYVKTININNWGTHHSDTYAISLVDNILTNDGDFAVSGDVTIDQDLHLNGNVATDLNASQDVIVDGTTFVSAFARTPSVYNITNAIVTTGLTINAPWPSHIKLIADPTLTVTGPLTINFSGTPDDGEELAFTVVQPADNGSSTTGRITELQLSVAGSAGNPGFAYVPKAEYASVTPHANVISTLRFTYVGGTNYFIKYSDGETLRGPSSFAYDWTNRQFEKPQKSINVLDSTWVGCGIGSSFSAPTNPVFLEQSSGVWESGAAIWGFVSGGNLSIRVLTGDGSIKTTAVGAVSGIAEQAAIREVNGSAMYIRTTSNVYRLAFNLTSTYGFVTVTSISNLGTASGGLLYPDKFLDRIYWGDGTDLYYQTGGGGSAPVVHTTMPSTIVDLARSPDGDIMVLDISGNYRISQAGLGAIPSWSAATNFAFPSPSIACNWDRVAKRWVVHLSNGAVYHSTNVSASAWVALTSLPKVNGFVTLSQAVGNAIVVICNSSIISDAFYSTDSGASWQMFRGDSGIPPQNAALGGFGYLGGHLIATINESSNQPIYLISQKECGRWGPLDIDK